MVLFSHTQEMKQRQLTYLMLLEMRENDPQEKKTVIIMFDKVTCSSMYIYMHTY